MNCINCNLELSHDDLICKYCGTKVEDAFVRCPKCFVKFPKGTQRCAKCGCDIKLSFEEAKPQKSKLTRKYIITLSSTISLLIIAVAIICVMWYKVNFNKFKEEASDYISFLNQNIETINMLAEEYNNIYNGQWLIQTELSTKLEKKYREEISSLRDSRDTGTYIANELAGISINDKDSRLVKKVFENYDNCYVYVISKKGKYPGYMKGYNELLSKYKESVKELKNKIK